jgi:hypothetical protein
VAVTSVRLAKPHVKKPPPLEGFGAQLNVNIFTRTDEFEVKVTGRPPQAQNLTPDQLGHLKEAIKDLKPGHCRIFVQKGLHPETEQGRKAPEFKALMDTIKLAQEAGANVNLTWWGQEDYANARRLTNLAWPHPTVRKWPQKDLVKWPEVLTNPEHPRALLEPTEQMRRFALIIAEARRRGLTCVTHATIQNEVNGAKTDIARKSKPHLSMRLYEWLYREFDKALQTIDDPNHQGKKLNESVTVVAGDLIERVKSKAPGNLPNDWLRYMHPNMGVKHQEMARVVDGYSEHLYWDPTEFPKKPEALLNEIVATLAALRCEMPFYITEYGVRWLVEVVNGVKTKKALLERKRPGELDGKRMDRSTKAAFQHAWFNALAPQLGCAGLVKWALYRTDIVSGWGEWGMIDAPSTGFQRGPVYRVTRLFNHLVPQKWMAAGLGRDGQKLLVSRFASPAGDHESIAVLNNTLQPQDVRVEKLKEQHRYHGASWNPDGSLSHLDPIVSDTRGRLVVSVPPKAVIARSTLKLRL